MELPATLKRVPKWAWLTTGGVVIGAGAIRLWQNRTVDTGEEEEPSNMEPLPADEMGRYGYGAGSVNPSGVIVPPVIIGAGAESGDPGLGTLTGLYMSGVEGVYGAFAELTATQNDVLANLIEAGSAPTPTPPVVTQVPTPAPAPAPAPPVVVTNSPQPTTRQQSCRDKFPNYPRHNDNNGPPSPRSCFKRDCRRGKRWHVYKDGHEVKMGDPCGGND